MNSTVKKGIIASIILVLLVIGFSLYYNKRQKNKTEQQQNQFINEKDQHLTEENRSTFETRLTDLNKRLAEAKTDPEKYTIYNEKGFYEYSLGHLQSSKESYRNVIQLQPNDATGHMGLYQTAYEMTDYATAEQSIKEALRISPTSAEYWNKYIGLEKDRLHADNDRISSLYSEAVVKTNNSLEIIQAYAKFLEDSGNLQAAKEYWQKAAAADPKNKKTYDAQAARLDAMIKDRAAQ